MSVDWPSYRRVLNMATDDVWASKYLGSDHHVDRVAFAKLDYHNKTGRVYMGKMIVLPVCVYAYGEAIFNFLGDKPESLVSRLSNVRDIFRYLFTLVLFLLLDAHSVLCLAGLATCLRSSINLSRRSGEGVEQFALLLELFCRRGRVLQLLV